MPTSPAPNEEVSPVPTGTVTFLFTDIEGSTRLLERLREGYASLLEEQRDILRGAFARWGGHEIDTQGDSFFAAFPRAQEAVQCVVEVQRLLAEHAWPQDVTVRVRMGLHTGEPLVARAGYIGMDVHRAARIAQAGHGGQVLLSQATRELIYQDLPEGVSLLELGEYKLKDIRFPQRIYQLSISGLPVEFPPLKTLSTAEEPPTSGEPPYKGLQYFDEPDAPWFFGRQDVTARLLEAASSKRFLAVIGASGSGKSSVVRAGLVPALKQEQNPSWQVFIFTPTEHPLEALAVCLTRTAQSVMTTTTLIDDLGSDPRCLHLFVNKNIARPANKGKILLIVDQFEELFTQCRDPGERRAFVENLLYAATADSGWVSVLITLRADFYEHVAMFPDLREAAASQQIYIGVMGVAELRQAIEEPAKRGGWELSPGLAELMLHDIGAGENSQPEPGALPLLSHALLETWKRRRANLMSLRAYTEAGGVRGAIAHTADMIYNQELTPGQQEIARNIFLRLTELGEGAQDTRRRISIDELIPPGPALETAQIREVLLKLADARLITTSEGTVEVAHEALIREWPALREWLSQDREGLHLHRHLTQSAQEWEMLDHDPGALYRGARLAAALEWAFNNPRQLNLQEQAFLNTSHEAVEAEEAEKEAQRQRELEAALALAEAERKRAEEQSQANKRLRQRAVYLAAAFVAALGLATAALFFFNRASQNANLARQQQAIAELRAQEAYARELSQAAEANLSHDPELSMLLALQAISVTHAADLPVSLEMQDVLHRAMQTSRVRLNFSHPGGIGGIDLSPDGTLLAAAGSDGAIRLWDAITGESIRSLTGHSTAITDVAFHPDMGILASAAADGEIYLWDINTEETILTLPGNGASADFITISPDGSRLAATYADEIVRVWDLSSNQIAGQLLLELPGQYANLAISPDGSRLATSTVSDSTTRIWDIQTGQELLALPMEAYAIGLAFSPDGTRLAVEGSPAGSGLQVGMITIFDAASGAALSTQCCHTAGVYHIDFSPDGTRLATAGQEGVAKVWDVASGRELMTLSGLIGPMDGMVFSPECAEPPKAAFSGCGRYVYTAGRDGTIKQWDVSDAGKRDLLTAEGCNAMWAPDSQSAEILSIPTADQVVLHPWSFPPSAEPEALDLVTLPAMPGMIVAGDQAMLKGSTRFVIASEDGTVITWEIGKPQSVMRYSVSISTSETIIGTFIVPGGLWMATNEGDVTRVWDVAGDQVLMTLPAASAIDISADGSQVATGEEDGTLSMWQTGDGQLLWSARAHDLPIYSLGFSPDGLRLASGSLDTTAKVWEAASGRELFSLRHGSTPYSPTFSPDGAQLATNQVDGSLYVWDVSETSLTAGQRLFRFTSLDEFAAFNGFSPDGRIVFVGGYYGQKILFYVLPVDDLVALVRSRLTRSWTQDECQKYLHLEKCP